MGSAVPAALSLASPSSSPNFSRLRRLPPVSKGSRFPRAALVEAKPLPALRPGGGRVNGEHAIQVVDSGTELPIRSRMDRASDIQAEARAMSRAVNASVYSPELLAARYGSRPIKVRCLSAMLSFSPLIFSSLYTASLPPGVAAHSRDIDGAGEFRLQVVP